MAQIRDFAEDLYAVLGVPRDAPEEEIRRAGRRRQRQTHPDAGGSAEEFIRVRLALEVLGDPQLRAAHDAWLDRGRRRGRLRRERPGRQRPRSRGPTVSPREPGTFVPRSEPAPPERIPKPVVDVRRMRWYRIAWPAQAREWPPAQPARLPYTTAELVWIVVHATVTLFVTVMLGLDRSIAALRPLGRLEGGTLWPLATLFGLVALAAFVGRVLGRAPVAARIAWIATEALALLSGAASLCMAFVSFLLTLRSPGNPAPAMFLAQGVLELLFFLTGLLAWRAFARRTRIVRQESLLVDLANQSAPAVGERRRVWGEPGRTAMGADAMRPGQNPMRAMLAQRMVGEALQPLLRIPGVRIVHGLRVPGGGPGTVPHAVVCGRRVALVDAYLWGPGEYGVDEEGFVSRDGRRFESSASEFPHAVEHYHRLLGETARVRGWLVIAPEREGRFEVDPARTWRRVRPATVDSCLREIGDWLAEEGTSVDRLLLRDMLRQRR
ncbi:MAG: DnaJ domain-containing protein [Pseudoclavibacter sp.]|nr:DnaJ domain-containing protein [Pseudoclavibacter sp.]